LVATGSAFGKTILIGDQLVLRGVPAIVAALPYVTEATVDRIGGEGWILEDERPEVPGYKAKKAAQQVESINRILEVMGIDVHATPIRIHYGGSLLAGSGVGASAASCVSLARALDATFDLGLSDAEINHIGREGEVAYHGIPSGVDNTASTYGGVLQYRVDNGVASFERITLEQPAEVVLANSGVTADTRALDGFVLAIKDADPHGFAAKVTAMCEQSRAMRAALERSDLATVGALMSANHEMLIEMGLSHKTLEMLCAVAIEHGALGAKLTGGGRGGYMLALVPDSGTQADLAARYETMGYRTIQATLGVR
jgi:mevalonate kinase